MVEIMVLDDYNKANQVSSRAWFFMKEIALRGKNDVGKFAIVDNDVFEWANKYKWFLDRGFVRRQVHKPRLVITLAREIIKPKKSRQEVSYINGNHLDCRKSNLRLSDDWKIKSKEILIDPLTGMVRIKLYGERMEEKFAIIDKEDYEWLNQWKWHIDKGGYAFRMEGKNKARHNVKMHRLIMNAPKGILIDHKNLNPLDNRKENLRFADTFQSGRNKGISVRNKSGYKGVYWSKRHGKWLVLIIVNYKKVYGKMSSDIIEAAKEYDRLARKHHGEFAKTNF